VEEVITALNPRLKKLPYQVETDIPSEISLNSFPGPLSRVLINCFNNAVLHGFEGRNQGVIKLSAKKLNALEIEITFSDDGKGMPEQVLHKVFDPFFTTKLGQGGSGLGMHIAYNTVTTVLGGHIDVVSSLDHGTSFHLRIPIQAPDSVEHII
jgi:signal transduction histidine kinase